MLFVLQDVDVVVGSDVVALDMDVGLGLGTGRFGRGYSGRGSSSYGYQGRGYSGYSGYSSGFSQGQGRGQVRSYDGNNYGPPAQRQRTNDGCWSE